MITQDALDRARIVMLSRRYDRHGTHARGSVYCNGGHSQPCEGCSTDFHTFEKLHQQYLQERQGQTV